MSSFSNWDYFESATYEDSLNKTVRQMMEEKERSSNGGWSEGMTYGVAGAIVGAVVLLAALVIYRRAR